MPVRKRFINRVDRFTGCITGGRVIHFIHVGKTGGSILKTVLEKHKKTNQYQILLHDHNFVFRMVPTGDAIIFFLRHPISRFISGFYSRQREGKPRHDYPWSPGEAKAFALFKSPNELALALSSTDAKLKAAAYQSMCNIQHVRDTYCDYFFESIDAIMTRRDDILFVGFQESLDADFERLKLVLDLPMDLQLPIDTVTRHSNSAQLDYGLDGEARVNLEAWYAEDIRFYSACVDEFSEEDPHPIVVTPPC